MLFQLFFQPVKEEWTKRRDAGKLGKNERAHCRTREAGVIHLRGMRTQELHAYLCRFCCSCRHLCCSCWWCWAAASRSSSAFLFSSLNSCLEVEERFSAGYFLFLPHPASYNAVAASWLRRKSPSVRVEGPSGPHRAYSRCFTSSSFTSISFSAERKSNEQVRKG